MFLLLGDDPSDAAALLPPKSHTCKSSIFYIAFSPVILRLSSRKRMNLKIRLCLWLAKVKRNLGGPGKPWATIGSLKYESVSYCCSFSWRRSVIGQTEVGDSMTWLRGILFMWWLADFWRGPWLLKSWTFLTRPTRLKRRVRSVKIVGLISIRKMFQVTIPVVLMSDTGRVLMCSHEICFGGVFFRSFYSCAKKSGRLYNELESGCHWTWRNFVR